MKITVQCIMVAQEKRGYAKGDLIKLTMGELVVEVCEKGGKGYVSTAEYIDWFRSRLSGAAIL